MGMFFYFFFFLKSNYKVFLVRRSFPFSYSSQGERLHTTSLSYILLLNMTLIAMIWIRSLFMNQLLAMFQIPMNKDIYEILAIRNTIVAYEELIRRVTTKMVMNGLVIRGWEYAIVPRFSLTYNIIAQYIR